MDPYEKLLSPRRMLRRSSRHRHGADSVGGESGEGSGGGVAQGSGSEGKKGGESNENEENVEDGMNTHTYGYLHSDTLAHSS